MKDNAVETKGKTGLALGILLSLVVSCSGGADAGMTRNQAPHPERLGAEETTEMSENTVTHYQKTDEEWRRTLTPEQYRIMRRKGTEPPFSSRYNQLKKIGVFHCAACGYPLFDSKAKFDSGTGWPSFYAPVEADSVETEADLSHGMRRIEVLCPRCGSHLGHVFNDGPEPTGQRYCINGAALDFHEDEED